MLAAMGRRVGMTEPTTTKKSSDRKGFRSRASRWLEARGERRWGRSCEDFDPGHVARVLDWMETLVGPGKWFDVSVRGWEHIPQAPALFVTNHSGGSSPFDIFGLLYAWHRHYRLRRVIHPLTHEFLLSAPLAAPFFSRGGAIRANREQALSTLTELRRDVLVAPGGDSDSWRPWRRRYEVEFAGHVGYARIALRAGVPIVPVANAGAHDTLLVLTDGRGIARRLHLHELFRIDVFPVHLSLPWGIGVGPLPHIPVPAKLRYQIGPPIYPLEACTPGEEPSEELVRECDARVRARLQGQLDVLAHPPG